MRDEKHELLNDNGTSREDEMSVNLFWRPYVADATYRCLSDDLRRAIAPRYWEHDGSLSGGWVILDRSQLDYIGGLVDAKIEDAARLKDSIKKYGGVQLCIG